MTDRTAAPIAVWQTVCKLARLEQLSSAEAREQRCDSLSSSLQAHVQRVQPVTLLQYLSSFGLPPAVPQSALLEAVDALSSVMTPAGPSSSVPSPSSSRRTEKQLQHGANGTSPSAAGEAAAAGSQSADRRARAAGGADPASTSANIRRGFMAANLLSPPLSRLLGHRYLSRPSVVRKLWNYIREHGLQRVREKRIIDCDAALSGIMNGLPTVSMAEMNTIIGRHLTPIHSDSVDFPEANKEATEAEEADREEDEKTGRKRQKRKRRRQAAAAAAAASAVKGGSGSSSRDRGRDRDRDRDRERPEGQEAGQRQQEREEEGQEEQQEEERGGGGAGRRRSSRILCC